MYKVDAQYRADQQGGINVFDPDLNIDYFMTKGEESFILSEKDKALPLFKDAEF
jgi:dTDP-4-dehydrorhamnose 3,5-epimerase-like enzyme